MATTKAKEDDDNDKKMTSTIPLPPPPTTTMTTATTTPPPPTSLNKFNDPPAIQDRQPSDGDVSLVSSTSFDPTEPSTGTLFLPLPNTSANKSRSSFVLSDDELPSEIANADISIARDGSFVETSSGAAARELKKRYDERLGVGSSGRGSYAISPYAITAFVNQHGKPMYRVGHRELSPPALSSEDADRQAFNQSRSSQSTGTTKSSSSSGPTKRRSRMSMHTFLPPTIFKSSHANTNVLPKLPAPNAIPLPPPHLHQQPMLSPGPNPSPQPANRPADAPPNRKLRKARSLSNMFGMANAQNPHIGTIPSNPPPQIVRGPTIPNHALGRPQAHSVTGADIPRRALQHPETVTTITSGSASMGSISSRFGQPLPPPPPTKDVFSDVMGWNTETLSEASSFDDSSGYGSGYGAFGWRPDVNVSGSGTSSSSHNRSYSRYQGVGVKNPFGRGVHFDPPVIRERGRGRERSWGNGNGLDLDVDGQGKLGFDVEGEDGEVWDAEEVKGYRYTDHLKVSNGPVIREMQSFESGLTARADPVSRQSTGMKGKERGKLSIKTSKPILESDQEVDPFIVNAAVDGYESSRSSSPGSTFPPSTPVPSRQTLPTHARYSSMSATVQAFTQGTQSPSLETSSHSRYSTQVFDVLQSYRGIPLLDKLSEDTEFLETTVIRLSAWNELSAAPKDDPRFVMWGEVWSGSGPGEEDGMSMDVNASVGGVSRHTGSVAGAESTSNHGSMVLQSSADHSLSPRKGKKGSMSLTGPGTRQPLTATTTSLTTLSAASLAKSTHTLPARLTTSKKDRSPSVPRVQPTPSSHLGHSLNGETPRKVLIAATIERWIAQLTSELNYDELLIFFLTYRTYVSAIDLCHLLICRFHWALESSSSSPPSAAGSTRSSYRFSSTPETGGGQGFGKSLKIKGASDNNDMVKRIVRVRTFIAIRYWLLTFFAIDFVPNRELRILFGNWLNTLAKDPTLHGKKDIMDIVRKLKKVTKDCVDLQTSKPRASRLPQSRTSSSRRTSNHQSRKSDPSGGFGEDSDVDLDFLPDSGAATPSHPQSFGVTGKGPAMSPASAADVAILQQPLHLAILSHTQQPELTTSSSSATLRPHNGVFVPSPSTLPFHHKPLSRAFVNTIGRLGRWKRVLNPRSAASAGGGSHLLVSPVDQLDISPFNLEPNATGDLLMVRGGVEQYLKMLDQQSHASSTTSSIHSSSVRSSSHPSSPNMVSPSISLPGTPGVSTKDIGTLHGGGATPIVSSTTPVSPSASSAGDRDGSERLDAVSEEPEDQDDAEVPPCVSLGEDSHPVPSNDTQDPYSLVTDAGNHPRVEVQEVADADAEAQEVMFAEEDIPDREADTTPHPIDKGTGKETARRPDSRPSSPESYDSDKSRRQAHESMLSGSQPQPLASLPPPGISGHSGGRGLTRGGYQHRFQHDSYWDIPRNEQVPDGGWQIDVVSIDDLDLSDMSSSEDGGDTRKIGAGTSDPACPPGLRRLPKKLPMRRDFEFIRPESASSFGAAGGHTSIVSAASSSVASSNITDDVENKRQTSASGEEDEDHPRLGRSIHQWQVNAIVDSLTDEEEAGDVDAALNRLEGRINQTQQTLKQSKVETWIRSIRERMANGLYGDEKPRFPMDDSDEDEGSGENGVDEFGVVKSSPPVDFTEQISAQRMSVDVERASRPSSTDDGLSPEVATPMAQTYAANNVTRSGPGSPIMGTDPMPSIEDVVPLEILRSRVLSQPYISGSSGVGSPVSGRIRSLPQPTPIPPNKPYRSFILTVRTGPLAEHLAVIERELFIGLKFEELVVDDWRNSVEESNILDWAQFLKDRATYKAEGRVTPKTSALVAFRARFNLFAKFVASEIVMTLPNERLNLVSKFIRVAWRLYERGAFNTLISLLAGLRSEWVTRAVGKRWQKLGYSEARVYRDLRLVTGAAGDFRYIRHEVEAIETEPITAGKGKGEEKIQPRIACIPFLGQYLSQLYRHCQLPDLIDPTSPNEPVRIDPETNTFEPPAHPGVFAALAPLPPLMQLEPLINIQKQRRIAGVIKSLVTGQHLASKVQFPIDKKLFQRCLRLKALDEDTLLRVYAMYPD